MDQPSSPASGSAGGPVPALLSLQIVWGALTASIVGYAGLAFAVAPQTAPLPIESVRPIELAFALASLLSLGASYMIPRLWLAKEAEKLGGKRVEPAELVRVTTSAWIVRLGLSESVGVFGLVLALSGGQAVRSLPFFVLSLLAMLTAFPSENALRGALEK